MLILLLSTAAALVVCRFLFLFVRTSNGFLQNLFPECLRLRFTHGFREFHLRVNCQKCIKSVETSRIWNSSFWSGFGEFMVRSNLKNWFRSRTHVTYAWALSSTPPTNFGSSALGPESALRCNETASFANGCLHTSFIDFNIPQISSQIASQPTRQ